MNALHKSLDETVAAIREAHEEELKAAKDAQFGAEVKTALLEDMLAKAIEARNTAERFSMKLLTQFNTVEAVFAEAKAIAIEHARAETKEIADERLPKVKI